MMNQNVVGNYKLNLNDDCLEEDVGFFSNNSCEEKDDID